MTENTNTTEQPAATPVAAPARVKASTWDRSSKTSWDVGYNGIAYFATKIGATTERVAHWSLFLKDEAGLPIGNALPPTAPGLRAFWKAASEWFAAGLPMPEQTEQAEAPAQPAAVVNPPEETDEHVAGPAAVVNPPAEDEQAEPATETALPLDVVAEPDESTPVTEADFVAEPPAEDATYPRFEVKREGKLALVIDTENGDKIVFRHRAVKAAQNKADKLEAAAAAAAEPVEPTE